MFNSGASPFAPVTSMDLPNLPPTFGDPSATLRLPVLVPPMSQPDNLKLVIEESLEVAFLISNVEFGEFTLAKVFDLFDQVFPTALVLNTAYWPFYSCIKGHPVCVCGKFGLFCRHVKNTRHCLDLSPITQDYSMKFCPAHTGPVYPANYDVQVKPLLEEIHGYSGYEFAINVNIQTKKSGRGRPRRRRDVEPAPSASASYPASILCRYELLTEHYPTPYTIVFECNLFCTDGYRQLLRQMPNIRAPLYSQMFCNRNNAFALLSDGMLHYTLVLKETNMPCSFLCIEMQSLSLYPHVNLNRNNVPMRTIQTQTDIDHLERNRRLELERYREVMGNIGQMWQYTSRMLGDSTGRPVVANPVAVAESLRRTDHNNNVVASAPVRKAIKQEPVAPPKNDNEGLLENIEESEGEAAAASVPFVRTEDEDYDIQWPSLPSTSRVIRPRSETKTKGRKCKDVVDHSNQGCKRKTTTKESSNENVAVPPEMPVQLTPAQGAIRKTRQDFRQDPDYRWFEEQLERGERRGSPLSLSDEFEIIDEVIREDLEESKEKEKE